MRLPGPYIPEDDELLYSFLVRMAEENFLGIDYFAENFIDDRPYNLISEGGSYKLPNGNTIYVSKIAAILGVDPLDFYLKTSLYPGTAPLQSPAKQSRVINYAFRENIYRYPHLFRRIYKDIIELKYCPKCRNEDLKTHEHTWLRRAHHMPGVSVCWKHGVRLGTAVVEHKKKSGNLIFPEMSIDEGTEEEKQFAVFAKGFLDAGFDTDSSMLTKILSDELEAKQERYDIRLMISKHRMNIKDEKILQWLFEVFHCVTNIPVRQDEHLFEHFSMASEGYDLLSNYSVTCVKMRKKDEIDPFITTPWGFLAGWRSPSEDCSGEQEKIIQILRNVRNDEYEPVEPITSIQKPVKILHKPCGKISSLRISDLIDQTIGCQCTKKSAKNIRYVKKCVEEAGYFKLISVADDMTLTIKGLSCGHVFKVKFSKWLNNPSCRICTKARAKITAKKKFVKKVADLVGDEYEVTGEYINQNTPIEILHKTCGETTLYNIIEFLHGKRCKCGANNIPRGKEFRRYVYERSCGLYEITEHHSPIYCIRNTKTGSEQHLKKIYIIQELERPTKSPILPVDIKGEFISDYLSSLCEKVEQFLMDNYLLGDMIIWNTIPSKFALNNEDTKIIYSELIKHGVITKIKGQEWVFIYTRTRKNNADITLLPNGEYRLKINDYYYFSKKNYSANNVISGNDKVLQEGNARVGNEYEIIDEKNSNADVMFSAQNEFRQKVKDIVGNEYEVTGVFIDNSIPVSMVHRKCGKVISITPYLFFHGSRCSCVKGPYGKKFRNYVRTRTEGLYIITDFVKSKHKYIIKNIETGEEKLLQREHIIQELERPTPSPILPVKVKEGHDPKTAD